MKAILGVVILVAGLAASVVLAAAPEAVPEAMVPEVPVGLATEQAAAPVPMVELTFEGGKTITGRLMKEDDQTVHVTAIGGGSIGYQRATIRNIRRFTMSAAEHAEKTADLLAAQLWKVTDAPGTFVKAREQYLAALALSPGAVDRDRVQAKLDALVRERDAWQAETLRRSEVQKAKDDAELSRLQKELTQQQVAALQAYEPRLRQAEQDLRQTKLAIMELQDVSTRMGRALDDLGRGLAKVQDDLDNRSQVFVPYPVFIDLKRSHDDLKREVDRLDRNAPRP